MSAVHLCAHSHYSLLNGLPKIDALVSTAAKDGMPAVALTDRNNLYGAIDFYKKCERKKIRPIIGVDIDVQVGKTRTHLILLAQNKDGYQNLIQLVSGAHTKNKDDIVADEALLRAHSDNTIVLVPQRALTEDGTSFVEALFTLFPRERVYGRLEWTEDQSTFKKRAVQLNTHGLQPVAAFDTYYLEPEDQNIRDIVRKIADPHTEPDSEDRTFIDAKTFETRYKDFPEALSAVDDIVSNYTH